MKNNSFRLLMIRHVFWVRTMVLVCGALILLWFGVKPVYLHSMAIYREIETKVEEETKLEEKVSLLSGIDPQILRERAQVLDKALPTRKDVVLYLLTLDGLSRELGLTFNAISLSPGDVTEVIESGNMVVANEKIVPVGVQSLGTDLKISGSLESINSFLKTIEQSLPLMQIKDVKIVGSRSSNQYSLSLRLGMMWANFDPKTVKGKIALFNQKEEEYFQQLKEYKQFEGGLELDSLQIGLGKSNPFESPILQP